MTVEPTEAERLRARAVPAEAPIMRQVWRHLGFLHWAVEPAAVARLLPPGLTVDTFDGVAYLGIVPFTVPLSCTTGLGLPVAPAFHEVNLRTYVHQQGRAPGVWFFSLDAASRLAVMGARTFYRLPYFHAQMTLAVTGDPRRPSVAYASRRDGRDAAPAEFRARYGPTGPVAPAAPGSLEFFLVERYRLYAWNGHTLTAARVHHAPYPLQIAAVAELHETLTGAADLPAAPTKAAASGPAHVHYAREVDVRIYRPHRVTTASSITLSGPPDEQTKL